MNKTPESSPTPKVAPQPSSDNSLAIVSMVLGVISLTGPGFLFGIPAIITAVIALKKKQGERGLSITGLVTGIVSTVVSLLFVALVIFAFIWGFNHPEEMRDVNPRTHPGQAEQILDSSET